MFTPKKILENLSSLCSAELLSCRFMNETISFGIFFTSSKGVVNCFLSQSNITASPIMFGSTWKTKQDIYMNVILKFSDYILIFYKNSKLFFNCIDQHGLE